MNHQFANGLFLNAHYIWSKMLDSTGTIAEDTQGINNGASGGWWNFAHPSDNIAPSLSDLTNQFVLSAVYELPVGRGRRYRLQNRFASALLSGWEISPVWTWQGGFPFGPSGMSDGLLGPNVVPGQSVKVPAALQHWYNGTTSVKLPCGQVVTPPANSFLEYNLCAFSGPTLTTPNGSTVPDLYWYGNAAETYDNLRSPGRFNMDASLQRTINITERVGLQISVEATNFLNRAEYVGIPGPTIDSSLGNTNTVAASGPIGIGTNYAYGTYGEQTYDPRQFVLFGRISF